MYIWASAVELGCSREGSFRVSTVSEEAVFVSSQRRWWKGAISDALQLGTGAAPSTIRLWGRGAQPASSSLSTIPVVAIPASPAVLPRPSGVLRQARSASSTRASWKTSTLPHCAPPLSQQASLPPASAWSPVLLGGATLTNTIALREPQSLVELGLQLDRQQGVSNTGNADPIGSEWLHTAPLPSARKESASAMLPPHTVTYNTSDFSPVTPYVFDFLIFSIYFLLSILETKIPQIFQGTTISGVKKDLHIPCFTNKAIKAFWVPDSTWAEPECSLYISYQIQFLKGEEVSLIALIKECV